MKKIFACIIAVAAVLWATAGLAGCNALPSGSYEKVIFAFNGVEKSFRSSDKKSAADLSDNTAKAYAAPYDQALEDIAAIYVSGDVSDKDPESFSYYEPPMIQFQCLKAAIEKIGKDYSFGTKYQSEISGEMYFDAATGKKISKTANDAENYKYNYSFVLALAINIDDNDLITADVSFDISLSRGEEIYRTNRFVNMRLDYDMKSTSPNYELLMINDNREAELPYIDYPQLYEYDYVQVKDSKIAEWRKFVFDCSERLYFDQTLNNFDAYLNKGDFYFRADTVKWFKDGKLRRITQTSAEKELAAARAFADGLGLNSTEINGDAFALKSGEKTAKINEIYREFSALFGDDVIYSLVCDSSSDDGENGGNVTGIIVYAEGVDQEYRSMIVTHDMSGKEFLTVDQTAKGETLPHPSFYYRTDNGMGEKITDLSAATFNFYSFSQQDQSSSITLDYDGFKTSSMQNIFEIIGNAARFEITINGKSGSADIFFVGDGQGDNDDNGGQGGNEQGNSDGKENNEDGKEQGDGGQGGDNGEEITCIRIIDEKTDSDLDILSVYGNAAIGEFFNGTYRLSKNDGDQTIKPRVYFTNGKSEIVEKADLNSFVLTATDSNDQSVATEIYQNDTFADIVLKVAKNFNDIVTLMLTVTVDDMTDTIILNYDFSIPENAIAEIVRNAWPTTIFERNGFKSELCPEFSPSQTLYNGNYKYDFYSDFSGTVFITVKATDEERNSYLAKIAAIYTLDKDNGEYYRYANGGKYTFSYNDHGDSLTLVYKIAN